MKDFDTISELKCYNLDRLLNIQKLLFREIRHYLNNPIYERNDIFFRLEELDVINNVINEKYAKRKNKSK